MLSSISFLDQRHQYTKKIVKRTLNEGSSYSKEGKIVDPSLNPFGFFTKTGSQGLNERRT